MVDYRLKQDIKNLIVCLYDPKEVIHFTTDTLANYIDDCYWQLVAGQKPRRIIFHVTPAMSEAIRITESVNMAMKVSKRDKQSDTADTVSELSAYLETVENQGSEPLSPPPG